MGEEQSYFSTNINVYLGCLVGSKLNRFPGMLSFSSYWSVAFGATKV